MDYIITLTLADPASDRALAEQIARTFDLT